MGPRELKVTSPPRRLRLFLALLVLAAANVALYRYGVAPRRAEAIRLAQRADILRGDLERGRQVEARLPQFRKEISEQGERLRRLREILPDAKETAAIVREIERLATGSNLKIRSFTPQPSVKRDFYEDWPILIAVEGDYSALTGFFDRVSKFGRLVNVENISIRGLDNPNTRRTLSATCTATTFVFLPGKGPV